MSNERLVYVGNLSHKVTEDILREIFVQIGPLARVSIMESGYSGYAWVEFLDEESVLFAAEMMNGIQLFRQAMRVTPKLGSLQELEYKRAAGKSIHSDGYRKRDQFGYSVRRSEDAPPSGSQSQSPYNMLNPSTPPSFLKSGEAQPGFKIPSSRNSYGSSGDADQWRSSPAGMAKKLIINALVRNGKTTFLQNSPKSRYCDGRNNNKGGHDDDHHDEYRYVNEERRRYSRKY